MPKKRKSPRAAGTNPRAKGTSSRQLGVSPRQMGETPRVRGPISPAERAAVVKESVRLRDFGKAAGADASLKRRRVGPGGRKPNPLRDGFKILE